MTLQKQLKRRYLTVGILGIIAVGLLAPMAAFGVLDKTVEEICEKAKGPKAILCDYINEITYVDETFSATEGSAVNTCDGGQGSLVLEVLELEDPGIPDVESCPVFIVGSVAHIQDCTTNSLSKFTILCAGDGS